MVSVFSSDTLTPSCFAGDNLSFSGIPVIKYAGIDHIFSQVDKCSGDMFVVKNVTLDDYSCIDNEREKRGRKFRPSFWSADTRILIITIPTTVHERLHGGLDDEIYAQVRDMRLKHEWGKIGAATFLQNDNAGNTRSKGEGDSARRPEPQRAKDEFPTLVVEARCSQSWSSLRNKARWWLDASGYDVKIVLLVKLERQSRQITIEKWMGVPITLLPGATTRARAQALLQGPAREPACTTTIRITRGIGLDAGVAASYQVDGGPLRLGFIDCFLRNPDNQLERDIVLDTQILQEYAVSVWYSIGH